MSTTASRIATVLRSPRTGWDYGRWLFQKSLLGREPVRNVRGVVLGGFNSFSEYHTVTQGVTSDEQIYINSCQIRDGDIIDVGANLGLFSLLVANRFIGKRIHAIEPGQSTFESLGRNIRKSPHKTIFCHQCAIADCDGLVGFAPRENARANASITRSNTDELATVKVPCFTLDSFCQRNSISEIALLKVDVEGYEALVFRGASHVLDTIRPAIIYFEICPVLTRRAGFDPEEPPAILQSHGYTLSRIGECGKLESVTVSRACEVDGVENWVATLPI